MSVPTHIEATVTQEHHANTDKLITKFEQDGYVVVEEILHPERCAELLKFIISSFGTTSQDFIIASDYRLHTPLELNPLTMDSMQQIVKPAHLLLSHFLTEKQCLAELSSITVFPNAAAQNLHPDERNVGKYLVSIFVNLAPTSSESGALLIVPGSHHTPGKDYPPEAAIPVEVPAGSAVFMNSKTTHAGGGNCSVDRIRPVFYFSLGDPDLKGPTYSIREDVKAMDITLNDLSPEVAEDFSCNLDTIPRLNPNVDLLTSELKNNEVFLIRNNELMGSLDITPEIVWTLDVIKKIADDDTAYSIAELSEQMGSPPEALLQVCRQLRYDQVISW